MTEVLKLPLLAREADRADIALRKEEKDAFTRLTFAASSETPVERWFGDEILSHDKSAIRLDRVKRGAAPLLFNHDSGDVIGMVDGARIEDSRLVVDAHFFNTDRAREIEAMVDGGLRNVSLQYRIHAVEEETKTQRYTVRDWEPLEVSIVSIPADATVGLGRSSEVFEVRMLRTSHPAVTAVTKEPKMADEKEAAAGESAEVKVQVVRHEGPSAVEMEKARQRGIDNLAKANGIDEGVKSRWISAGTSLEQVSEDLMQILKSRSEKATPVTEIGLSDKEARRFSLARAINACADQNWADAGLEAEVSREIGKRLGRVSDKKRFYVPAEVQKRDLTVASAAGGGYLVETKNQSFIEILRNSSVAIRMGTQVLGGLQGSVTVPKQTGAATNYWLATEATAITESQQTFGQMALSPKTAGAYTEISRQLLLQSSPGAEQPVQSDLAQVVALAVDLAVLNGSGSGGQPTGIIGTSGIGSVTGTSLAYAGIVEFQTDTAGGNALFDSSGYVTTPAVAGLLKQRVKFSSTASPIWEGKLLEGTVDGYRAMASNQVPSANILFGDFSKVVLAEWGVLEVEVNPYANFAAGIVGVRAMYSIDVGVRYAAAFSLATSVT